MKNIFLTTPLAILLSMFCFNSTIEAAGCNTHKNKNVKVECSLSDENCEKNKFDKSFSKVDV
tara:strand:+ start:1052 stop:1237 length:186 start_codon:yes stop_codon:yes gene_type:complete